MRKGLPETNIKNLEEELMGEFKDEIWPWRGENIPDKRNKWHKCVTSSIHKLAHFSINFSIQIIWDICYDIFCHFVFMAINPMFLHPIWSSYVFYLICIIVRVAGICGTPYSHKNHSVIAFTKILSLWQALGKNEMLPWSYAHSGSAEHWAL